MSLWRVVYAESNRRTEKNQKCSNDVKRKKEEMNKEYRKGDIIMVIM